MELTCENTIDCQHGAVRAVRFNVNGSYSMTCGSDKKLKLWDPYSSLLLKTFEGHKKEVLDACSSYDSRQIASCSSDKSVIIWDVSNAARLRRLRGHLSAVTCAKFNQESTVIVSGSLDNTVLVWDIRSYNTRPIYTFIEAKNCINSLQVSKHEILTGSEDGSVRRYDMRSGDYTSNFLGAPITCVSFSHDGKCILASTADNTIRLLDKNTGDMLGEYTGHSLDGVTSESAIIASDKTVLSGSLTGELWCWDLASAEVVAKYLHTTGKVLNSLSVHPTKDIVLTAAVDTIKVWNTGNQQQQCDVTET